MAGVVCHIIVLCLKQRKNPFDIARHTFEEKGELLDRTVDPTRTQTAGESLYDVMTLCYYSFEKQDCFVHHNVMIYCCIIEWTAGWTACEHN